MRHEPERVVIDLGCDTGEAATPEGAAAESALLEFVTSVSIACGGHAGDDASMRRAVSAAAARGRAIGAHPSYPDRAGFGRAEMDLSDDQVERCVAQQAEALSGIAAECGVALTHLKPHGALYHAVAQRERTAEAVARAARRVDGRLVLVGPAGARSLDVWRGMGMRVAAEGFVDRAYEPDGSLRSRALPGALLSDPRAAAAQAVRIAAERRVVTALGEEAPLRADTLCLHSDTPGALEMARAVHIALRRAGVVVRPLGW